MTNNIFRTRPVQEPSRAKWSPIAGKSRGKDGSNITAQARRRTSPAALPAVPTTQEVVPQRRGVEESLQDGVHEAGVAQIVQPSQPKREAGALHPGLHTQHIHGRRRRPAFQHQLPLPPRPLPPELHRPVLGQQAHLLAHDGHVEVRIVHLIPAGAAEQLRPLHIHRDLVVLLRLAMRDGVVGHPGGRRKAEDFGADQAEVEAAVAGRAGAAPGHLRHVPEDADLPIRRRPEAALQRPVPPDAVPPAVLGEVGAGYWVGESRCLSGHSWEDLPKEAPRAVL